MVDRQCVIGVSDMDGRQDVEFDAVFLQQADAAHDALASRRAALLRK
jgi:hypothetical protein